MLETTAIENKDQPGIQEMTSLPSCSYETMGKTPFPSSKDAETQVNVARKNVRTQVTPRTASKGYIALLSHNHTNHVVYIHVELQVD